jgi:hypothetical protein
MTTRLVIFSSFVAGCGSIYATASDGRTAGDSDPEDATFDDSRSATRTAIAADAIAPVTLSNATFARIPFVSVAYDDRHELSADNGRFTTTKTLSHGLVAKKIRATRRAVASRE